MLCVAILLFRHMGYVPLRRLSPDELIALCTRALTGATMEEVK